MKTKKSSSTPVLIPGFETLELGMALSFLQEKSDDGQPTEFTLNGDVKIQESKELQAIESLLDLFFQHFLKDILPKSQKGSVSIFLYPPQAKLAVDAFPSYWNIIMPLSKTVAHCSTLYKGLHLHVSDIKPPYTDINNYQHDFKALNQVAVAVHDFFDHNTTLTFQDAQACIKEGQDPLEVFKIK
jgi:hypothetical protein